MSHRPWSKSKLDTANGCPLRYRLQYVEKAQRSRVERGEGRIGKAAHQVLESLLRKSGKDVIDLLEHYADEQELTSVERERLLCFKDQILSFMVRFGSWMAKKGVTQSSLGIEKKLAIMEDFSKTSFWNNDGLIRGVVDLMVRVKRPDGLHLVVIDHKTGNSTKTEYHIGQKKMYDVMSDAAYRNVKSVTFGLHFLASEEIKWFPPTSTDIIRRETRPWLLNKIQETEASLQARTEHPPLEDNLCPYCSFQHRCPLK